MFARNCPILERTGDGRSVGRCWFVVDPDGLCPRHGDVKRYLSDLPRLTDENVMRAHRGLPPLWPRRNTQ